MMTTHIYVGPWGIIMYLGALGGCDHVFRGDMVPPKTSMKLQASCNRLIMNYTKNVIWFIQRSYSILQTAAMVVGGLFSRYSLLNNFSAAALMSMQHSWGSSTTWYMYIYIYTNPTSYHLTRGTMGCVGG